MIYLPEPFPTKLKVELVQSPHWRDGMSKPHYYVKITPKGKPPVMFNISAMQQLYQLTSNHHQSIWGSVQDAAVYSDPAGHTLVFTGGTNAKTYARMQIPEGDGVMHYGQCSYVYHPGWPTWKRFMPPIACHYGKRWLTDMNFVHRLDPGSFSVSPNGLTVVGQFSHRGLTELWKWDLRKHFPTMVCRLPWEKGATAPKYGYAWRGQDFYWTPLNNGPMYLVSRSGRMRKVLRMAPFRLDLYRHLAFGLSHPAPTKRFEPDRELLSWLGKRAYRLDVRRFRIERSGKLSMGKLVYQSKFRVYPSTPEFLIQHVKNDLYYVPTKLTYAFGVIDYSHLLHLPSGAKVGTGTTIERTFCLSKNYMVYAGNLEGVYEVGTEKYTIHGGKIIKGHTYQHLTLEDYSTNITIIYLFLEDTPISFYQGEAGPDRNTRETDRYLRPFLCSTDNESKFPMNDAANHAIQYSGPARG